MDSNERFINNPQNAFAFLQEVSTNARFVVDKLWENAKFFTTITSAILTFSVAAILTFIKDQPALFAKPFVPYFLSALPAVLIAISGIGMLNLRREYKRFLLWTATSQKLYDHIGLSVEMKSKRFVDDKYLLPKSYVEGTFKSTEDFVDTMLKKKHTLIFYFNCLHWCYMALGIVLIVCAFQLKKIC